MLMMIEIRLSFIQVKIYKYITSSSINYGSIFCSIAYLKELDTDLLDLRSYLLTNLLTPWLRVFLRS